MISITLNVNSLPKKVAIGYQYDNKETIVYFTGLSPEYTNVLRVQKDGIVYNIPLTDNSFTITNAWTQTTSPLIAQVVSTGEDYQKAYSRVAFTLFPTLPESDEEIDYPEEYVNYIKQLVDEGLAEIDLDFDISDYASLDWVQNQHYLTQHQDITGKANAADLATVATSGSYNDLTNKPSIPSPVDLTGYATQAWVGNQHYLTSHQDITGKVNATDIKSTITTSDTNPVNSVAVIAYINSLDGSSIQY